MKSKLLIITLILPIFLMACGKNKNPGEAEANVNSKNTVVIKNEGSENSEENMPMTSSFDKEYIDNLIENSTYISKVRIQSSSTNGVEANFLTDYLGDLSNIEVELPKSLSPNKEYIVFYKDGEEGKIEPTRGGDSFIEIQDENDGNLVYLEEKYIKEGTN
ncbi:ferlin [Peptoniphilus raoultii]|uniref:ferlin n=1 Tax=Peptoniphilus raoultii TaxID=1776387 RepID=UPI0008D9A9C5|nr:ferlin [Peptoniphilus raoultii]